MAFLPKPGLLSRLRGFLAVAPALPADIEQARSLIRAIDAGGVPLNPVRVNVIARNLGLEVSKKAAVEDTIRRIRAALERT